MMEGSGSEGILGGSGGILGGSEGALGGSGLFWEDVREVGVSWEEVVGNVKLRMTQAWPGICPHH